MAQQIIVTQGYFDGTKHNAHGPYSILIDDGWITDVVAQDCRTDPSALPEAYRQPGVTTAVVEFAMPGLVEAHCHLFLDGAEHDLAARSSYLQADQADMMAVAQRNLAANRDAGITLIRDAGDKFGINHALRDQNHNSQTITPTIRSPGLGIRAPKRYGGFMAREAEGAASIEATVTDLLATGDDLKILLTGIIDFATGSVKGAPQFNADETSLMVQTAHRLGRKTFAHCSGTDGLAVAVAAGVDSIEHGFFMTDEILNRMADKAIAWVPTVSPVHFQMEHPAVCGWDGPTVDTLRRILDEHRRSMEKAAQLGVPLVAGSDAGSLGVRHGAAMIDEIFFLTDAGLSLATALRAATSMPRNLWGAEPADIAPGNRAELITLSGDPFAQSVHLRQVSHLFKDGKTVAINPAAP